MALTESALKKLKLEVEIRKLTAEAEQEEYLAKRNALTWAQEIDRCRVFRFNDEVSVHSATVCIQHIRRMLETDRTAPIEIVFNSPGGEVFAGLELFDHLMALRAEGAVIDTTILGMGASMAGVIPQAGRIRRIGPTALMMVHEVASLSMGKISSQEDRLEMSKLVYTKLLDILASRSKLTADEIRAKAERKDWWLSAQEALEYGLVDEILPTVEVAA